jgi:hypothetical protein
MKKYILIITLIGGLVCSHCQAVPRKYGSLVKQTDNTSEQSYTRGHNKLVQQSEITSEQSMEVKIELTLTDLALFKADEKNAFQVEVRYDSSYVRPLISYKIRGNKGILDLGIDTEGIDIGNDEKKDSSSNSWKIGLTDKIPLEINTELAMGKGQMDLSGLQISNLKLEVGLSDFTMKFDEPNPISMDRMAVECGLGSLKIENLGNASLKNFKLESGLGSAVVDFSGNLPKDFRADMEVGLGSLEIIIPKGTPVKVYCDCSFLSSIDFEDFKKIDNNTYLSPGFDRDKEFISLNLSVGLGSAKIRWKS